uniref:Reverse transcriptase Ty1/copia-type domain-containing protein n=1 Tax=Fagus sylvatica TaxID=28930 RepID=A0A2N9I4V3_FAGSY
MFLMNCTRPDIAYAVSRLSRYTHNPSHEHWTALTRLLRYLKGTMDLGLHFAGYPIVLEGYCDANWISDNDETNSTSGYVFTLGGGAVSWKSSKQTCKARSTMESEFVALEMAGTETEWLRTLLVDIPLWTKPATSISLHCDSQAAIGRAKNKLYNGKQRHMRLRHNIVQQLINNGVIALEFVRSEKNLADPLTKGLSRKLYTLDEITYMGVEVEAASYESLANSLKPHEYPGRTQGRNASNLELAKIRMQCVHKIRASQRMLGSRYHFTYNL